MEKFYRATMKITGDTVFGRLAFTFLLICAIAVGAAVGLLFVYSSDLPEIRALQDYRPNVVTELYADDGQPLVMTNTTMRPTIKHTMIRAIRSPE